MIMIASPPVEPKDAGEHTICEYRKNKPRVSLVVCKWHVEENDPACAKCRIARKIKEQP